MIKSEGQEILQSEILDPYLIILQKKVKMDVIRGENV